MNTSIACPCGAETELTKDFLFETVDSVNQLNPLQWNRHVPESNYLMQYDYLAMIEKCSAGDIGFRYVMVKHNAETIGVLYFQVVMFKGAQLMNYFPENAGWVLRNLKGVTERFLNSINMPMLVSGNVFMTGENGFYFSQRIDKPTRARLLRKAARNILQQTPSIKATLISDLYEPKTEFDRDFKLLGYNEITVESDMTLQVKPEWKSFEDYLNAMSSKYRVRAKKVYALCHDNGVEMRELNAEEIAAHQPRIFELYNKVMANADFKLATLPNDYFYQQKLQLPQHYHLFAYFKDGLMIGFISAFHIGKRIEVHYTGMDHVVCKPIHLYQHMMYDMVGYAVEHKADRLHFGRTAPEIKSTIGAEPQPMYGYLKHRNAAFNFLIMRPYTARLKPKAYQIRSPFK
ncbi:MAG: peptidogalycan biosysnthesis protein [Chitinophagales bacterium]